jgi:flagellar biosynthetic protein FliR
VFSSIVIGGGEIIDMQMGLGMSKIYDPQSNIQLGITANMYNALFIFVFFAMGCHLNLIEIFMSSYKIVPYGNAVFFTTDLAQNILTLCMNSVEMSIRFALPIMAVELFLEMGIGLLMKAVPQINVFTINIQLKLVLGLFMMIVALPMFTDFLSRISTLMLSAATNIINLLT